MSEDNEGWIEHDGKGMPVDAGVFVQVKYRDGMQDKGNAGRFHGESLHLSDWVWPNDDEEFDIIAYRVVKP